MMHSNKNSIWEAFLLICIQFQEEGVNKSKSSKTRVKNEMKLICIYVSFAVWKCGINTSHEGNCSWKCLRIKQYPLHSQQRIMRLGSSSQAEPTVSAACYPAPSHAGGRGEENCFWIVQLSLNGNAVLMYVCFLCAKWIPMMDSSYNIH